MLTEDEKAHLGRALAALGQDDAPWQSVAALAQLAQAGTDVSVDFSTTETLGAPVIIAQRSAPPLPEGLTPRQQEVCALVAQGLSNKAIARALDISPATVKDHVHAILTALNLRSRSEVVSYLHHGKV
ncbi:LuxR C-terminal-related transcriptional regulator [Yoonia sp. R2331]|uniref:helix-turn-helix domain-containing protein n=1 Tax=Yoonia sp. R2331 TaxID=3237238 RepID=UPI0034E5AD49